MQGAAKHAILERVGGTTPRFYKQGASLQSRPTETTQVCPGGTGSHCRDVPSFPPRKAELTPHLSTEEHAEQDAAVMEGQPLSVLQTEDRRAGQQGLADHTGHGACLVTPTPAGHSYGAFPLWARVPYTKSDSGSTSPPLSNPWGSVPLGTVLLGPSGSDCARTSTRPQGRQGTH